MLSPCPHALPWCHPCHPSCPGDVLPVLQARVRFFEQLKYLSYVLCWVAFVCVGLVFFLTSSGSTGISYRFGGVFIGGFAEICVCFYFCWLLNGSPKTGSSDKAEQSSSGFPTLQEPIPGQSRAGQQGRVTLSPWICALSSLCQPRAVPCCCSRAVLPWRDGAMDGWMLSEGAGEAGLTRRLLSSSQTPRGFSSLWDSDDDFFFLPFFWVFFWLFYFILGWGWAVSSEWDWGTFCFSPCSAPWPRGSRGCSGVGLLCLTC